MKTEKIETSIFPLVKRFQALKSSETAFMLTEELIIHVKCFRNGTIFSVLGWKEINNQPYLIINKGSWEALVDFNTINNKILKINAK